jgi:hypothetical protein
MTQHRKRARKVRFAIQQEIELRPFIVFAVPDEPQGFFTQFSEWNGAFRRLFRCHRPKTLFSASNEGGPLTL